MTLSRHSLSFPICTGGRGAQKTPWSPCLALPWALRGLWAQALVMSGEERVSLGPQCPHHTGHWKERPWGGVYTPQVKVGCMNPMEPQQHSHIFPCLLMPGAQVERGEGDTPEMPASDEEPGRWEGPRSGCTHGSHFITDKSSPRTGLA